MILSGYRRDDYADPDGFVAQLLVILEQYSDDLIEHVTSPMTGMQARLDQPPNIAKAKAFCEQEAARRARLEKWRSMKSLPSPKSPKLSKANCLVRTNHPRYRDMVERSKHAEAREFIFDVAGIWVAEDWVNGSAYRPDHFAKVVDGLGNK